MRHEFNCISLAKIGIFFAEERDMKLFVELAQEEYEIRIGRELGRWEKRNEIEHFDEDAPDEELSAWYSRNQTECDEILASCYEELCQEILRDKDKFPGVVQDFPPALRELTLEDLDLSIRAFNSLKRACLNTVGAILDHGDLSDIRNLGKKGDTEVMEALMQLLWDAYSKSD